MNSPDEALNSGSGDVRGFGYTAMEVAHALDDLTMQETVRSSPDRSTQTLPGGTTSYPGVGTIAFRRYCLQRVLGRGGMGIVWLALDMKLERTVALKFLPDFFNADAEALREMKDETRRGLDLAHPNIVRIYDFVDDSDSAAISMEYVDGRSLHDSRVSHPNKVFSVEEITPWVRQLCEALDYAHTQRQIIHRDLKPANLMVNSQGQLKITDFGIARSLSDTMSRVTGAGNSGTLLYMSPQQSMGDRPLPTDDIYSVGATLYDLLTGKPPFYRGDVAMQVASKIAPSMMERRVELEVKATDVIPPEWEETVAACLDKDPTYRPQSGTELVARLGLEMKGETKPIVVVMRPEGSRTSYAGPVARSRAAKLSKLTVALAVFTILTVLAVALSLWSNRSGSWAVETNPPGAFVTIGDVTQVAPARFEHLPPGLYHADITMDGFEAHGLEFKVKPGQMVDIGVVRLIPAVGNVTLTNNNEGEDFELKAVATAIVPPQADVGEPPNGFWSLDEMFIHSEYAGFSTNGRRFLLSQAQEALKELGHLKTPVQPSPNEDLHRALKIFQSRNNLKPNGLLDSATIIELGIGGAPDKADWTPGSDNAEAEAGWWTRNVTGPLGRLFGPQNRR